MSDFLVFEGVTKRFGDFVAVNDVSFSVERGEIFSLLGPSGCGKTTLLRMVAGFIAPDEGRILIEGQDISELPPERRPVNTVFQSYALFPHLTICENIGFGLRMAKRPKTLIDSEVDRMLKLVDLVDHADKKPNLISGGQKQRVAIARALVNKPRVLLLDEPLAALDLKLRQRLLVEMDEIHDEVGITFLYVTHDQTEAMAISDRIGVMNKGGIAQIGNPVEIYESPISSFVAAFIGDTNFLRGRITAKEGTDYSVATVDGVGEIRLFNDRPLQIGDEIALSLRPEKLRIERQSATEEVENGVGRNRVPGMVEDVIYLGSMTRYWVRVGEQRVMVERQHSRYLLDETPPTWKDRVWLSWRADDGCVLSDFSPEDAELLSLPTVGDHAKDLS
ncbi:MAG: ABC transporter ATP-binding protein [Verrucomicrobiae bacterium]|nr:ABC transporter ATP-binding protein [Verrucomicrobiae bacterium]